MKDARGRKEIWRVRSAFVGAVAVFPWLASVVPWEFARGRINVAGAAFIAGAALLWLGLLVLSALVYTRGDRGFSRRSFGRRPVLLLLPGLLLGSIAAADAVALYVRGWLAFGVLASAAAALFIASLALACLAAIADS